MMKNEHRRAMDLPPLTEDTHEVCKHMRASSPPASAADLIEAQQLPRRNVRGIKKVGRDTWWQEFVYYTFIKCLHVYSSGLFGCGLQL